MDITRFENHLESSLDHPLLLLKIGDISFQEYCVKRNLAPGLHSVEDRVIDPYLNILFETIMYPIEKKV